MAHAWWRVGHETTAGIALSPITHFLLGSRGNRPQDIWGIWYFAPFSTAHQLAWSGQWPLVGWQNMLIAAVLIASALTRATRTGYSPLLLASPKADLGFVSVLRKWRRIQSER